MKKDGQKINKLTKTTFRMLETSILKNQKINLRFLTDFPLLPSKAALFLNSGEIGRFCVIAQNDKSFYPENQP